MTTAADTSDQLIAFVYVSLCGQRDSRDVERTSAVGHRHVTTLGGTVPRCPAYVAGHGRAEAVERQVWRRAAAERAASSRWPGQTWRPLIIIIIIIMFVYWRLSNATKHRAVAQYNSLIVD